MLDLVLKVNTQITDNNLDDFAKEIKEQVNAVSTELKTDDDFAEAKDLVKSFKKSEDALKAAKEQIFEGGDLRKINDTIIELSDLVRDKRLLLNKLVTTEEAARKQELIDSAFQAVEQVWLDAKWNKHIEFPSLNYFTDQIKGKKLFEKMKDALDRFVGIQIQSINSASAELVKRAETIEVMIEGNESLFDMDQLISFDGNVAQLINDRVASRQAEIDAAAEAKAQEMAKAEKQANANPTPVEPKVEQQPDPEIPELTQKPKPNEPIENYVIRISLQVSQSQAQQIAKKASEVYGRENVQLTVLGEVA